MRIMHKNSGFTLVEVMTCLAIMAILASIITPNYLSWLPSHRLGAASRDVLSVLRQARMIAVKENSAVTVQFDLIDENYYAFLENGEGLGISGDGQQNGGERTCKNGKMPAGIELTNTTLADHRISFNSRGLPNPAIDSTINITNSQNAVRQIIVNQTGHTKILMP